MESKVDFGPKKYDLKPRLKVFLKAFGMTANRLEILCGFSKRYFSNVDFVVPEDKYEKILSVLPQLNRKWLETGEGIMYNDMLRAPSLSLDGESSLVMEYRKGVYDRLVCVLSKNGFSVDSFENTYRFAKGTVKRLIIYGESPVLISWVFDIMSYFPGYSIEWVLYGRGVMNFKSSTCLPVVTFSTLIHGFEDISDNWFDVVSCGAEMAILPDLCQSVGRVIERGFLFVVPPQSRFYGGWFGSTGDYLLCEYLPFHPSECVAGDVYLFFAQHKVFCCEFGSNGFRVDIGQLFRPIPDVARDSVLFLGHVLGHLNFCCEETCNFSKL